MRRRLPNRGCPRRRGGDSALVSSTALLGMEFVLAHQRVPGRKREGVPDRG